MTISLSSPAGICVSVGGKEVTETLDIARSAETGADVIEIRLDSLPQPEIAPFVKGLTRPLLFTNRPEWEGGSFQTDQSAA